MNPSPFFILLVILLSSEAAFGQTEENGHEHIEVKGSRTRKPLDLEKVSESASRLGLSLAETPASVEIIDEEAMRKRGDTSLLEAVEGGTGMTAGNPPGAPTIFSTRGFSGDDVTILHDGFRITNPGMSTSPADSWNLQQVEILKGPSSVLHGLGAVGGTINFVSKKPSRFQTEEALFSYGSWNKMRVGLGAGGPISEALAYRVDVSQQNSRTYVDEAPYSYSQASGGLLYTVSDALSLALETDYQKNAVKSYFGTPLRQHRIDTSLLSKNYNVTDNHMRIESNWMRLRADYSITSTWKLSNLVYRYAAKRHWKNGESYRYNEGTGRVDVSDLIEIGHDQSLLGNQLLLQSSAAVWGLPNNFLIGLDLSENRFEHINNSPYGGSYTLDPQHPEDIDFDSVREQLTLPKRRTLDSHRALFLENRLKFASELQWVLGLRADRSDIESRQLNPNTDLTGFPLQVLDPPFSKSIEGTTGRVGLVSELHPGLHLYAHYSSARSSPATLVTLAKRNADFKLEKADELEAGIKHSVGDRLDYTASLYQISKRDLMTTDPDDPTRNLQIGRQASQGGDLAWAARLSSSLSWQGNLSLLKARYEKFFVAGPGGARSYQGKKPVNVPERIANTWLSFLSCPFQAQAGLRYVGEQQGDFANSYALDAYTLVQASLIYAWDSYELSLHAKNLGDKRYVAWNAGGDMALIGEPRSYDLTLYAHF